MKRWDNTISEGGNLERPGLNLGFSVMLNKLINTTKNFTIVGMKIFIYK